jgi:hypothetical protein
MKYTEEQIAEAIKVAEEHGFVVSESTKAPAQEAVNESEKTPSQEEINEAVKVAQAHGLHVIKEDGEELPAPAGDTGATAETGAETPSEDDGELITIQVTKAEFEAIKSIIDKVEYESDESTADAEQAAAVVGALDNENVYTAYSEA